MKLIGIPKWGTNFENCPHVPAFQQKLLATPALNLNPRAQLHREDAPELHFESEWCFTNLVREVVVKTIPYGGLRVNMVRTFEVL